MNREGDLSTEDLARPAGARQTERSTADAPREQVSGVPAADDAGPVSDPSYSTAPGGQPPLDGTPGVDQEYDERAGRSVGPDEAGVPQPGRADVVDDRLGAGPGDQGVARGQRPGEQMSSGGESAGRAAAGDVALLGSADEARFRQRWGDVQARFVDDPQEAVHAADGLVAELMQSLAQGFSEHKGALEAQWQSGGDPDTEELRQALQRYRSFFDRLLST